MEEVGNILPKVFKKKLLSGSAPVLEVLVPLWPRAVGKLIAQNCRPAAFAGGTLTVAAGSPSWAVQLRQMSEKIRAQINCFVGGPVVKKLRILHRPDGKKNFAPPIALDLTGLPLACLRPSVQEKPSWEEAGLNPELAGIVERSFVKYFSRNIKRTN